MISLQELLAHFDGVKRRNENEYMVRCPCHDDNKQSLSIGLGEKGIVLHCHAGCDCKDILNRIGVRGSDLFYDEKKFRNYAMRTNILHGAGQTEKVAGFMTERAFLTVCMLRVNSVKMWRL